MEQTLPPIEAKRVQRTQSWWLRVSMLVAAVAGLYRYTHPTPTPLEQVRKQYLADIVALDSATTQLHRLLATNQPAVALQQSLRQTRLAWKRVEWLAEVYNPETSKAINGPALAEVEEDDGLQNELQGTGLQVLEEGLFPYDPVNRAELVQQAGVLQSAVRRLHKVSVSNPMTDSHVFDALRLEVFRLITLGITGFDAPIANTSLPETAEALASMQRHLAYYPLPDHNSALTQQLEQAFSGAITYLNQASSFNRFDRLTFIQHHANVLSSKLLDAQQALSIPVFQESRLLSAAARTLNDPDAFDPSYFVDATAHRATPSRTALGKQLFYDPILSGAPNRSCATCHQPANTFTDGQTKHLAVGGRQVRRNTPTVLNAAFQAAQFADSRVVFLEDQAGDVIQNQDEMHGSLPRAVTALKTNATYRAAFVRAYPDGVTERNLKNAIASYIRSLTSLDTRLDRAMRTTDKREQETLLSAEEQLGFNLFMGKAKCGTCHFYPLFNGTVPPTFQKTESEVLGTPATAANQTLDPDLGKFGNTHINLHRHSFKTPTVRFTANTAPYMHNGVYQSLAEVVDFYDRGGGVGLGFNLPNQTLPSDKLNLTSVEKKAIVAFLKSL
ncbi:cytochrome-c peroxidase [Fibrella aquatilis]|uniref:Cytochrome-c peroxidase n=1 Tax=Fibrella aquatilis TaxID=2817059 RepID=A0A939K358_9BACT|nr:cytochrome c peroxidase [Fibrella aquatilis]MBO0934015.1 cytochrome-c peroxidase [Fibrella aquatilis]